MSPVLSTSIMLVCLNYRLVILPLLSNIPAPRSSPSTSPRDRRRRGCSTMPSSLSIQVARPTDPYVPNIQKLHARRSLFADRSRPAAPARAQEPLSFAVSSVCVKSVLCCWPHLEGWDACDSIAGIPLWVARFTRQAIHVPR
jgi:hypothetical protein